MNSSRYFQNSGSMQSKSIPPTSNPTSSKRVSAYDKNFEGLLIDYHVYPDEYEYPYGQEAPELGTLEELAQRLSQRRPSLAPPHFTTSDFRAFRRKNRQAINEDAVMRDVIPIIAGNSDIPSTQNLLYTRLDSITNGTTVNAQPDFYDGARLNDVDKQVQKDLRSFIIPTGHRTAPVAPNFFLEVKHPSGGADVAVRQACFDGALGARGMHQLQSYRKEEPVYDGNAYTVTSTYHDGGLKMYTTHPTQSIDGTTEYHMTQVNAWSLTGNLDNFRQGATAFRNAREWAQEQRDGFISVANKTARAVNAEPPAYESCDHKTFSDPTNLQDTTHPTQVEDRCVDSQYYMSQRSFH